MTYSHFSKPEKQLRAKPVKWKKYLKHNAPKARKGGRARLRCTRCLRIRAHVSKYGLHLCRQCFRELAPAIGFKKFS